jgi:hypothetical protein
MALGRPARELHASVVAAGEIMSLTKDELIARAREPGDVRLKRCGESDAPFTFSVRKNRPYSPRL